MDEQYEKTIALQCDCLMPDHTTLVTTFTDEPGYFYLSYISRANTLLDRIKAAALILWRGSYESGDAALGPEEVKRLVEFLEG